MQLSEFVKMSQKESSLQSDLPILLKKRSDGCVLSTFGVDRPHLSAGLESWSEARLRLPT